MQKKYGHGHSMYFEILIVRKCWVHDIMTVLLLSIKYHLLNLHIINDYDDG